jgi:cell division protein FtsI/penicillin-binding protein 2
MSSDVVDTFRGLSALFGSGSVTDPSPVFAEKRRETPVMEGDVLVQLGALSFVGRHEGPVFTLFRYDDIRAAFLNNLPERVAEARENDLFVPVITLRRDEYDEIAGEIGDLPGVQTRDEERHLAPTRTFARALLGTVGEVTAEVMEQQPGVFAAGDQVGYGGLSGHYDDRLRGVTGQAVVIARPSPGDEVTEIELDRVESEPGQDLATTLDADAQTAAEAALAAESRPAALVAIRISDGSVLAVANTEGDEAHPVNLALTASVPPGSTFKMVSGYQLLASGELDLDTEVACPE